MTWGARARRFWMSAPRRTSQSVGTDLTLVSTREAAENWGSQGTAASPSIEKAAALDAARVWSTLGGDSAAFSPHTGGRRVSPCTAATGPDLERPHTARRSERTFPGARATTRARGSRRQTLNRPGVVQRQQKVSPGQELRASGPVGPSSEGPTGP